MIAKPTILKIDGRKPIVVEKVKYLIREEIQKTYAHFSE
jgi:hypothetical protein